MNRRQFLAAVGVFSLLMGLDLALIAFMEHVGVEHWLTLIASCLVSFGVGAISPSIGIKLVA